MPGNKDIKIAMSKPLCKHTISLSLSSFPQIDKIMSSIGAGIGTELEGITENHSGSCVYVCVCNVSSGIGEEHGAE